MLPVLLLLLVFSFRKLGDEWSVDQEVTDEFEAYSQKFLPKASQQFVEVLTATYIF